MNSPIEETVFFDDTININEDLAQSSRTIHIRYQATMKRKGITSIEGLADEGIDIDKFLKKVKKTYHCNGSKQKKNVLQFSGDQRDGIKAMLKTDHNLNNVILHGQKK